MRDAHDDVAATPVAVRALAAVAQAETRDAVLETGCAAAKVVLPMAADVSVTVLAADAPRTVASTGSRAVRIDEAQYAAGEGPCLQAAAGAEPVLVSDLLAEERWPAYRPAATAAGIRASLSVPLRVGADLVAAVNLYAEQPQAFDGEAGALAPDLVRYIAAVLAGAEERQRATRLAEHLQRAMDSRAVIEQAKGILMVQRGCNAQEAFDALVRISQESHRKLRDVAEQLVAQVGR